MQPDDRADLKSRLEAEVPDELTESVLEGMFGRVHLSEKVLDLEREPYTLVQKIIEEWRLMIATSMDDRARIFAYQTPRPLTPLYNFHHPRSRVAREIFDVDCPRGISIISESVLREICAAGQEGIFRGAQWRAITERVRKHGKRHTGVFSLSDSSADPLSFGAIEGSSNPQHNPVVFQASQATSEESAAEGGTIMFGDMAQSFFDGAKSLHAENIDAGRDTNAVLRILASAPRRSPV